jgi:hypothetical protein
VNQFILCVSKIRGVMSHRLSLSGVTRVSVGILNFHIIMYRMYMYIIFLW